MRFSCASTQSVIPPVEPPKHAPRKAPAPKKRAYAPHKKPEERPRMRTRSASRAARLENAAQALKKMEKKAEVPGKAPDPYIYIGNLQGDVTDERLHKIFSRCGKVTRIQIRCSGGPVTVGARLKGDRQYATVEFTDLRAIKEALALNGRRLNGVPVVITLSAVDLPEMKDIIESRLDQMRSRGAKRNYQTTGIRRPLQSEPTEPMITDGPENGTPRATDRIKVMGYSFAATVV